MRTEEATVPSATRGAAGPAAGERWARYRLREPLGTGGMGTVWAAHDPELDREIALKVLHDELLGRAGQERLRDEARAIARVQHPNVVAVFDVGEHGGRTYYTMELVRGRSVKEWLAAPRTWREVQRVFAGAARGLAAIHAAGLVHRDIKPGNLLLGDDGRARVADLGLAIVEASPGDSRRRGTCTPARPRTWRPSSCAAPPVMRAPDQFAFGVALWEAARAPFRETNERRLAQIERGPRPNRHAPCRAGWMQSCGALAHRPGDRFADTRSWRARSRARRAGGGRGSPAARRRDRRRRCGRVRRGPRRWEPADACAAERDLAGVWDAPVQQHLAIAFAAQ
ncbi:MAG: serine/threonine protein kinase [Deltaproteobacteria bacterium]|nr:serine/threonine protein kinase [Deltaproteobacteria bacterium]